MTLLQALVLGIVQGATEFIPVSSSAHLVLVPWVLGWSFEPQAAFAFDVLVQLGTLVAVLVWFWRDWAGILRDSLSAVRSRRPAEARLAWLLLIATLPAAAAGVLLKQAVEDAFASPAASSAFLLLTAGILASSELLHRRRETHSADDSDGDPLEQLRWSDALIIGLAQALSLFPGVSRSGATIAAGIVRGISRPQAARFSFLMAVPIMLGAGLIAALDLRDLSGAQELLPALAAGFFSAAVVGALGIRWLLRFLARRSLWAFAAYCALFGVIGLAVSQNTVRHGDDGAPIPSPLPRVATTPALESWAAQRVLSFRQANSAGGIEGLGFALDTLPSEAALAAAAGGEAVLAIVGIPPPEGWFATPLGRLGIAIVIHPANPIRDLSQLALRELFTGRMQTWVGWDADAPPAQPVIPLADDELRLAVQLAVMDGERFSLSARLAPSPAAMASLVGDSPGALGMLPLTELSDSVRTLRVDGEGPTEAGVQAGRYPLWVQIVATAPREPTGTVRQWLGWMQAGLVSSNP